MKANIVIAGMFIMLSATAVSAQSRDTTSEGQATINEEQKLGPNATTSQVGNERVTNGAAGAPTAVAPSGRNMPRADQNAAPTTKR
jgi:hypothetical protein